MGKPGPEKGKGCSNGHHFFVHNKRTGRRECTGCGQVG